MHRLLLAAAALLVGWSVASAQTINRAEYFIDQTGEVGTGTLIAVTVQADSVLLLPSIPTSGLAPGFHMLYVRTRNNLGKWSMLEGMEFFVNETSFPKPAVNIRNAEYFIDANPMGVGAGIPLSIGTKTGSLTLSASIPTAGLSPGFHYLHVRTQDTLGKWGLQEPLEFYVEPVKLFPKDPKVAQLEYFFDNDANGVGKMTALVSGPKSDQIDILRTLPTTGLAPGFHSLFVRGLDTATKWGLFEEIPFWLDRRPLVQPDPKVAHLEYFFDNDANGVGKMIALASGPKSGTIDVNKVIPTTGLTPGFHSLFIRGQDTAAKWGLFEEIPFWIDASPLNPPARRIAGAEYFIDQDLLGVGKHTPLSTGVLTSMADVIRTVSTSNLSPGFHQLFVRTKDSAGTWGFPEEHSFYVDPKPFNRPAPKLVAAEYFFKDDPGHGLGIPVSPGFVKADTVNLLRTVSTVGRPFGLDTLYVRAKDSSGVWGMTEMKPFRICGSVLGTPSVAGFPVSCPGGTLTLFVNPVPGALGYRWLGPGNFTATGNSITRTNFNSSMVGDYRVVAFRAGGTYCDTSNPASIAVSMHPVPIAAVSAVGLTNVCQGQTVKLRATKVQGQSYQWLNNGTPQVGATADSLLVAISGSYSVKVTTSVGCEATSNAVSVSFDPYPTATASAAGPTSFCDGGSVVLNASTASNHTYQWLLGGTPISGASGSSYTATAAGAYSVRVTSPAGCQATSAAVNVTVNPIPTATVSTAGSSIICQGGTVVLNAGTAPGQTYQWLLNGSPISGATLASYSAATGGFYSVQVMSAAGCSSTSANVLLTVNALPTATASAATATTFCQGGSVVLNAGTAAGQTYQWLLNGAPISAATSTSYTATASGSYSVKVSSAAGCEATSTAVPVVVHPLPSAVITNGPTAGLCQGNPVVLQAQTASGQTYQWLLNGSAIGGATNASYTASISGSYTLQVTSAQGCSQVSSATVVTVHPLPTATATPASATTFCQGGSVVLNAGTASGQTYQWLLGGTPISGATGASHTTSTSGTYSVKVTSAAGCEATSAAVSVVVNALPTASIASGPLSFCAGSSLVLQAQTASGQSYQWFLGGTPIPGATNATYTTTAAGSYSIQVTSAAGCSSVSTALGITVDPLPTATATAASATTFCQGASVVLNAGTASGQTYQWLLGGTPISGATAASFTATAAGSYSVKVASSAGCEATSSAISVLVNPVPTVSLSSPGGTTICQGGSVLLTSTATNASSYQWLLNGTPISGAVGTSYTASVTGTYTLQVTSSAGCTALSGSVAVTQGTPPAAAATPLGTTTFCAGGSVVLLASSGSGYTYQWLNNGTPITGATATTYTANAAGSYSVQITSADGCQATSAGIVVVVNPAPPAVVTPLSSTTFCPGGQVQLVASFTAGSTYQWLINGIPAAGATAPGYVASNAGSYSVAVTSATGCSATSAPVVVSLLAKPTASVAAAGPTTFCQGGSVVLNASPASGHTYQWTNAGVPIAGATLSTYTAATSGSYAVQVTSSSTGCSDTSSSTAVNAEPTPTVTATSSTDTAFCPGESVLLSAGGTSNLSYQWLRNGTILAGATGAVYTATTAGTYSVRGTSANQCSNVSNNVTAVALPGVSTSLILGQTNKPIRFQPYPYTVSQNVGHTYVWTAINGAILSGQGTNSVSVVWNDVPVGKIIVVETNGKCLDSASANVLISMTSIDEVSSARSRIYPNPSDGVVSLQAAWPDGSLELVNGVGQVLFRASFTEGVARWDWADLPKGVYQAVLTGPNDEREVLRVVLQ